MNWFFKKPESRHLVQNTWLDFNSSTNLRRLLKDHYDDLTQKVKNADVPPDGARYRVARDSGGIWRAQKWTVEIFSQPPMPMFGGDPMDGFSSVYGTYKVFNELAFDTREQAKAWMERFLADPDPQPTTYPNRLSRSSKNMRSGGDD